jgi:hypothetical protein
MFNATIRLSRVRWRPQLPIAAALILVKSILDLILQVLVHGKYIRSLER